MSNLSHVAKVSASLGFQTYLTRIYHYMAGGLAVSGISAFLGAREPLVHLFYTLTPKGIGLSLLGWAVLFAPLIMVFILNSALSSLNTKKAQLLSAPVLTPAQQAAADSDTGSAGWAVLGFFFPLVGLILYLVWKDSKPLSAKQAGKGALIGVIVSVVLSFIYGILLASIY